MNEEIIRFVRKLHLPYFTNRGWLAVFGVGVLAGIVGGILYSMAVSLFSK